jgi:hypothetical protein
MNTGNFRGNFGNHPRYQQVRRVQMLQAQQYAMDRMESTEYGTEQHRHQQEEMFRFPQQEDEKEPETEDSEFLNKLVEQWKAKMEEINAEEEEEEKTLNHREVAKIINVVSHLMHGDIVSGEDENTLKAHDKLLYENAKHTQILARLDKKNTYDIVWRKEVKEDYETLLKEFDEQRIFALGTEIANAAKVMASSVTNIRELVERCAS